MSQPVNWSALALLTLRDPRGAAEHILTMNLPRDALWTALALVAAANTFIFVLSETLAPSPVALPPLFQSPLALFIIIAGGLVVTVHAIYWTGRALGGQGDLGNLLALVVWLQGLRAVAQVFVLILTLAIPGLAILLVLVVFVMAIWILLNFINVALNLGSIARAVTILVAASLALLFGMSLLLSMIGITALGVPSYV